MTVVELPRLGSSDAKLLLERVAGGKSLPKDVTSEILAPTEGIPLFIEELTRSVLETGILREGKERYELDRGHIYTIPRTLHGSLLARLDRLGPGREVVQIGAVIGREFSYELICAVAAMPEPTLRTALDRLSASELVYCRGTPPLATYMFKHALVRDAAYGILLRACRIELHAAIARVLENVFPEIGNAQPELLAHHYREADNVGKAVSYLSVAGGRSLSRSALTEAHKQIRQALQLISTLADDDSRRRDELKLQIALARTLLEQKGYADSQVGDAYARADDLSKRVVDTGMQLAVYYGLWAHHYIGGKPKAMLRDADEFLALAKHQKEVGGVTVYSYLSWTRWLCGLPDQAADAAAMAEESGRASRHVHSLFYALWHAGMANVLLRNEAVVARLGGELTKLANDRELPYWQALGNFLLGWHAKHSGRPNDAIERLQRGLELWEQRGSRVFRPICMAFLADAYAADDQLERAHCTFEEALRIGTDSGERGRSLKFSACSATLSPAACAARRPLRSPI